MFLINFDIIDSQKKDMKLAQIPNINKVFKRISECYSVEGRNIQIHDGDQIRIVVNTSMHIFKIILNIFSLLEKYEFKARVFLTFGSIGNMEYKNLLEADGSLFHRNRRLETLVKSNRVYYNKKENSIRYLGETNTDLIDLLCLSLSRLCLNIKYSSTILNLIFYEKYNQSDVGKELEMSQVNVSKKLKNINSEMFLEFTKQIELLLEEEVTKGE